MQSAFVRNYKCLPQGIALRNQFYQFFNQAIKNNPELTIEELKNIINSF